MLSDSDAMSRLVVDRAHTVRASACAALAHLPRAEWAAIDGGLRRRCVDRARAVARPVRAPDPALIPAPARRHALTLVAVRLFLAAGTLKKRHGSACWADRTCLYSHYETQPMPNALAYTFHARAPRPLLRAMQAALADKRAIAGWPDG